MIIPVLIGSIDTAARRVLTLQMEKAASGAAFPKQISGKHY